MKMTFEISCVSADGDDINEMCDAARQITLATFKRKVDWQDWAQQMGYDKHLPVHRDWHVAYFKSRYRGRKCYYAVHSAIEYVFTKGGRR